MYDRQIDIYIYKQKKKKKLYVKQKNQVENAKVTINLKINVINKINKE